MARILLIDDDAVLSDFVRPALQAAGHQVDYLASAAGALDRLERTDCDVVLLDNRMPGLSGIELLAALRGHGVSPPVILMTGDPTSDTAMAAMNLGAFDYVVKPLELDELVEQLLPLILKAEQLVESTRDPVRLPGDAAGGEGPQLLGSSRPMQELYKLIGKVAAGCDPILILGETGTGKELVAGAIHAYSERKQKPLVTLNCSNLVEDDLFGHEAGAFPGADKLRKGWFEYAHGGTLFLNEVSDLPLPLQAKLLPILKTRAVVRAGGSEPIPVDVRVVSATSRDLPEAIRSGQFREDLFYRLSGVTVRVPPLRERGTDVELLAKHYLARLARSTGRAAAELTPGAWEKLRGHRWPGNIWELQNVLGRAVVVAQGPQIATADLELEVPHSLEGEIVASLRSAVAAAFKSGKPNLIELLRRMLYRELLVLALTESRGDQDKAERMLGSSLDVLMEDEGKGEPGAGAVRPKPASFQVEALLRIAENPEWTAAEIAQALGCSRSKLYRDPLVRRALKTRSGDSALPPRGYKTGTGDLEAEDD
ncbi:MAG TPA: sigma-54 dependent transcriptional regulator [Pirellulaceae bacterium]|nr:sigma-54 dependent transcriptional regulator [Pirellulaceae bacterium]